MPLIGLVFSDVEFIDGQEGALSYGEENLLAYIITEK